LLRFRLFVRYLPELTPNVWIYWSLRYRRVLMLLARSMGTEAGPKVSLLIVGRLHGVTRKRLRAVVEQIGGELASRPSSSVDIIALAHGSAPSVLRDAPRLALPTGVVPAAKVISELTLKRMLGLVPPAADQDRTLDEHDLMRASKLPADMLACLAAFDLLEPIDGRFIYQDVLVAREVGRLLGRGYSLAAIVAAAVALRRSRVSLSQVRLVEAPWGDLVQDIEGMFAGLDGQLALPLAHQAADSNELFERAEMLEAAGDLAAAERSYRAALAIDRTDPALPYNLANVLDEQDRRHDAILAYYEALRRDPDFAEAWFNLGVIAEGEDRIEDAIKHYRQALFAQPNFADALFNLALLLTDDEDYREAASLWERFLALNPQGPDRARAKRCAALCRLAHPTVSDGPFATSGPQRISRSPAEQSVLL
jgi:tetratricopeptide (TPR) repeat protein